MRSVTKVMGFILGTAVVILAVVAILYLLSPRAPEIPQYPRAQQVQNEDVKNSTGLSVEVMSFVTQDKPEDVLAFYKGALAQSGWSTLDRNGDAALVAVAENYVSLPGSASVTFFVHGPKLRSAAGTYFAQLSVDHLTGGETKVGIARSPISSYVIDYGP